MTAATVMRRPAFAALLVANAVSIAGTRMTSIAVPWLVLTTTASAAKTGVAALAELLPLVIAQALAGPLVDRYSPRRVIITSNVASAAFVSLIPLLHSAGALSFPQLLLIVAFVGAARGPAEGADMALLPGMARAAGMPLERVSGLVGTADRSALLVAPAVAGFVIAGVGAANTLLIDALSFLVCALAVAAFAPDGRTTLEAPSDEPYLAQLATGLRFLREDGLVRGLVAMLFTTNLLDTAYSSVLLPVWVHSSGHGPQLLGALGSAFGFTATAGALLAAAYGSRLPRRLTYLVGFFLAGAPRYVALATGAPLAVVFGVNVIAGLGAGFLNPILAAVFAERVPAELFGRVSALIGSLAWAGMPLGGLLAGAAVAALGVAPALLVAGGIYCLATTLPGLLPEWRDMDRRPYASRTETGEPSSTVLETVQSRS